MNNGDRELTTTVADDALLMAYVDGELSPQQCEEIEQLMNASPEVAERVALLMSSALPYSEAFARQAIPPVPDSLVRNVDALIAQHAAAAAPAPTRAAGEPESLLTRLFGRPKFGWLAVAFATGATCYGLVLQAGFIGGALNTDNTLQQAPSVAQVQASPWVMQAASYQQLYTRETVNYVTPETDDVRQTIADIRQVDGLELRVPDLSAAGLTFKRVQRLRFNNKALVQLVYLPQQGAPVALCVMKEPKPDQSIAQLKVSGMDVVVWRQSQLGYALIGAPDGVDLNAVARLVADRSSGQLYTANARLPSPFWFADIRQ
ncbi:anti-sigma factor [Pseudomonas entomophila]|uniref:anti-sigma factor n=1 Tax=Pseudomonas entomophila TaxID=312306 RepID=UPI0023D85ECC|nr:anti-sigma factor [Pseudomonas entomophila]MDF0730898.1 anti-sigma factor [Pseudomonas entomophila]